MQSGRIRGKFHTAFEFTNNNPEDSYKVDNNQIQHQCSVPSNPLRPYRAAYSGKKAAGY